MYRRVSVESLRSFHYGRVEEIVGRGGEESLHRPAVIAFHREVSRSFRPMDLVFFLVHVFLLAPCRSAVGIIRCIFLRSPQAEYVVGFEDHSLQHGVECGSFGFYIACAFFFRIKTAQDGVWE